MQSFEWAIEDVIAAYPSLSLSEHAAMAVALMTSDVPPCDFHVQLEGFTIKELAGESEFSLSVSWNAETRAHARRLERTIQRASIIEGGAIALAALLFSHLMQDSDMEVTKRQARADYLLKRLHCALEVSGTEQASEVPRRIREKRRQVLQNVFGLDGYALICCFDPGRRMIRWSYHQQPE